MALFPREIESERLRYRYIHPDADHTDVIDWYEYHRVDADGIGEATRWLHWEPHRSPKETKGFVDHCGERFDKGEGVTYAIYPREGAARTGEFAGSTGLDVDWDRRVGTLGVWLRKPFWGRGYSGERAARLMELAFDRLDLEVVAVEHHPENDQSRRAIEKYVDRFGGRREGTIRNGTIAQDGTVSDTVRYSVLREEWRVNRES